MVALYVGVILNRLLISDEGILKSTYIADNNLGEKKIWDLAVSDI